MRKINLSESETGGVGFFSNGVYVGRIQANSWLNDCFENAHLSYGKANRTNGILNDMNQIDFMVFMDRKESFMAKLHGAWSVIFNG